MNPAKPALTRLDMLSRAQMIRRTLGVRCAAAYMRNRGFSVEAALSLLVYCHALTG